jgi:hypothetical protein
VIRLSADMATRMKMDLNSALLMVAKSMQDPITGATALRRAGVMLTDSQEELIKKMVQAGDGMGAQKIILRELATEFEGSAVAAGKTLPGQLDILKNTINSLLENFGTALMPGLQEVTRGMIATFNDPQVIAGVRELAIGVGGGLTSAFKMFGDYMKGSMLEDLRTVGSTTVAIMGNMAGAIREWQAVISLSQSWAKEHLATASSREQVYDAASNEWVWQEKPSIAPPNLPGGMSQERYDAAQALMGSTMSGTAQSAIAKAQKAQADMLARIAAGKMVPTGYNFSGMGDLGATPGALGGGLGAGLSMSMPDVLARAFGSMGEAQGWQGAFASQHGGQQAGVTDVRDMMAGNAFAARTGRAATEDEWKARYYSGGFEGEDKLGLDAIFGKPGTWSTLIEEKGKQEAEQYKLLVAAFDKGTLATDTSNSLLGDILAALPKAETTTTNLGYGLSYGND